MPLTRSEKREMERLEERLEDLRAQDEEDDEQDDGEAWDEAIERLSDDVGAVLSEVGEVKKTIDTKLAPNEAIVEAAGKRFDTAAADVARRIDDWKISTSATAAGMERIVQRFERIMSSEKLQDVISRSVLVVKDRGAHSGVYSAIFNINAIDLAREFIKGKPHLIICAAIWQGALKIGDVVEQT